MDVLKNRQGCSQQMFLACICCGVILADADVIINEEKIQTLLMAAGIDVDLYWPGYFANAFKDLNVKDCMTNLDFGVEGAAPAAGGEAEVIKSAAPGTENDVIKESTDKGSTKRTSKHLSCAPEMSDHDKCGPRNTASHHHSHDRSGSEHRKEKRDRKRFIEREKQLREEERRRERERQRETEVERIQREEFAWLARERGRLRLEKEWLMLEREKLELERAELLRLREQQRLEGEWLRTEREKLEWERTNLKRLKRETLKLEKERRNRSLSGSRDRVRDKG